MPRMRRRHPPPGLRHLATNDSADARSSGNKPRQRLSGKGKSVLIAPALPCGNCGAAIGKLQKPLQWGDHQVCSSCHHELRQEQMRVESSTNTTAAMAVRSHQLPATNQTALCADSGSALPPGYSASGAFQFTLAFWGACFGLFATAIAIFLVIFILQSLSVLVVWALLALALVAGYYWVRRGVLALRVPRRARGLRDRPRLIRLATFTHSSVAKLRLGVGAYPVVISAADIGRCDSPPRCKYPSAFLPR